MTGERDKSVYLGKVEKTICSPYTRPNDSMIEEKTKWKNSFFLSLSSIPLICIAVRLLIYLPAQYSAILYSLLLSEA